MSISSFFFKAASAAAALVLSACGNNPGDVSGTAAPEKFAPVLDKVSELISNGSEAEEDGFTGIDEILIYAEAPGNALGYCFRDFDADGSAELLIGDRSEGNILAAFVCRDGAAPRQILEGWARNRYFLLKDGTFINSGSGGAEYSIVKKIRLDAAADSLECIDCYFTSPLEGGLGVYHSTGALEPGSAEKVGDGWDKYSECYDSIDTGYEDLEFIPFSGYEGPAARRSNEEFRLKARLLPEEPQEGEKLVVDDSGYAVWVELTALDKLLDFNVVKLNFESATDEGELTFSSESVYGKNFLGEGAGIYVKMAFEGSIPGRGLSYNLPDKSHLDVALSQSGRDGSIVLSEVSTR